MKITLAGVKIYIGDVIFTVLMSLAFPIGIRNTKFYYFGKFISYYFNVNKKKATCLIILGLSMKIVTWNLYSLLKHLLTTM